MDTVPAIRQELSLFPGPMERNGALTFTINDPPANRFFHLSHTGFEILSRWGLSNLLDIVDSVNKETTLSIEPAHVFELIQFLYANYLIDTREEEGTERLLKSHKQSKKHPLMWLITNYLFFRIPLIRPDRFLKATYPFIAFLFTGRFIKTVLVATLIGVFLVLRQWETFIGTFTQFGTLNQLFFFGLALSASKIIHELGHAYSAHRNGCRIGSMGIAFIVLWPMLYTDTNEAWKLVERKKRLEICASGVLAEMALAGLATLLWSFFFPGVARSVVFFLATTSWLLTLTMNISPFMRFDGYFILSDLLRIQNLHERSFAMARWWMRETLFGLGLQPAERFTPGIRRFLILFAFGTWLYRFILFLSIALMVYLLFFKALGLILMGIELSWFIGLPIIREVRQWRKLPIDLNKSTLRTFLSVAALGLILVIPMKTTIKAPAVLFADRYQVVYAATPGKVENIAAKTGQKVNKGDLLMQMSSPDLEHKTQTCLRTLATLEHQLANQPLSRLLLDQGPVLEKQLEEAVSRLQTEEGRQKKLILTAPIKGTIVEMNETITQGAWLPEKEPLFYLTGGTKNRIRAYVNEENLNGIKQGGTAIFYPDIVEVPKIICRIIKLDHAATGYLEDKSLASVFGGPIPASKDRYGRIIPKHAIYRILLIAPTLNTKQILRGTIVLKGPSESILRKFRQRISAVIIRESGF